jgi:hypothetical protein
VSLEGLPFIGNMSLVGKKNADTTCRRSAAAWKEEKESKAEATAQFTERRRVSGRV